MPVKITFSPQSRGETDFLFGGERPPSKKASYSWIGLLIAYIAFKESRFYGLRVRFLIQSSPPDWIRKKSHFALSATQRWTWIRILFEQVDGGWCSFIQFLLINGPTGTHSLVVYLSAKALSRSFSFPRSLHPSPQNLVKPRPPSNRHGKCQPSPKFLGALPRM